MVNRVGTFGFPFMYTGEMMDANALVYLRARYYHPGLGVFTSLDPVEGVNRYQYVYANPVNMTDPSGLQAGKTGCNFRCFGEDIIEVGAGATLDCVAGIMYRDTIYDFMTLERRIQEQNRVIAPHLADPTIPINPTGQANYFLFLPPELTYCHLEPVSDCVESEFSNEAISQEAFCSWTLSLLGPRQNPDQTWINCFNKCRLDKIISSGTPSTICDDLTCRSGCDDLEQLYTVFDWTSAPCALTPELVETMTWAAFGLIPGGDLISGGRSCVKEVGLTLQNWKEQGISADDAARHLFDAQPCLEFILRGAGKELPGGDLVTIVEILYVTFDTCSAQ